MQRRKIVSELCEPFYDCFILTSKKEGMKILECFGLVVFRIRRYYSDLQGAQTDARNAQSVRLKIYTRFWISKRDTILSGKRYLHFIRAQSSHDSTRAGLSMSSAEIIYGNEISGSY